MKHEKDGSWRAAGYFIHPRNDDPSAEQALGGWLRLVDNQQYGESWDAAATDFRSAITRPGWEKTVRAARAPLGKVIARQVQSTNAQEELPGAPKGHYVVVQTNAKFENKASAIETCTLQQAKDGQWRVVGYFIAK